MVGAMATTRPQSRFRPFLARFSRLFRRLVRLSEERSLHRERERERLRWGYVFSYGSVSAAPYFYTALPRTIPLTHHTYVRTYSTALEHQGCCLAICTVRIRVSSIRPPAYCRERGGLIVFYDDVAQERCLALKYGAVFCRAFSQKSVARANA